MARIKYNTIKELQEDYQQGEFNFDDLLRTFESSIIDVDTKEKEEWNSKLAVLENNLNTLLGLFYM